MTPERLERQTLRTHEEAQTIFDANQPLAGWYAGHYVKLANAWCLDYADIRQEALIGLWYAALTFDPSKGVKFSVHARSEMRAQIQGLFRSFGIVRGAHSGTIQPAPITYHDLIESVEYQGHRNNRVYHHTLQQTGHNPIEQG